MTTARPDVSISHHQRIADLVDLGSIVIMKALVKSWIGIDHPTLRNSPKKYFLLSWNPDRIGFIFQGIGDDMKVQF